ncbi:MAG: ribonuclease M5 [Filifactor alocis]|nr:ribonuclease M5 [Filifactor alocis]
MIKEVIVVEGKDDIAAVKRAVEAEVIATNGYGFPRYVRERIRAAAKTRGIIVLTDPDYAGERIRSEVVKLVKDCKHAFITQEEGSKDGDIGVENASPEVIVKALQKARCQTAEKREEFTIRDMISNNLMMGDGAKQRRIFIGENLGIGYTNAKQFLSRLNHYGVTREEFENEIKKLNG